MDTIQCGILSLKTMMLQYNDDLEIVLSSFTTNLHRLGTVACFMATVLLLFAITAITFFEDHEDGSGAVFESWQCQTLLQCFVKYIYLGESTMDLDFQS